MPRPRPAGPDQTGRRQAIRCRHAGRPKDPARNVGLRQDKRPAATDDDDARDTADDDNNSNWPAATDDDDDAAHTAADDDNNNNNYHCKTYHCETHCRCNRRTDLTNQKGWIYRKDLVASPGGGVFGLLLILLLRPVEREEMSAAVSIGLVLSQQSQCERCICCHGVSGNMRVSHVAFFK